MFRVCVALGALLLIDGAANTSDAAKPTPNQIFAQIRTNVLEQLKQSANYTCTEVLDRSYYSTSEGAASCSSGPPRTAARHPYMHDRLRLDVAVSDTGELFSWHGGQKFSSHGINSVVRNGAVSSGSFVGYLSNIFLRPGVRIRYTGAVTTGTESTVNFEYDVPLASSNQTIEDGDKHLVSPFHGSFAANAQTMQLTRLDVVIDHPPAHSEICSARMTIRYQLIRISDQWSLIPRTHMLDLDLSNRGSSVTRTEFADCHAFRGESSVHYLTEGEADAVTQAQTKPEEAVPERVSIYAAITTSIDDRTSFTGDPIEATLLKAVTLKDRDVQLRKGAKLKGIITRLQFYDKPAPHFQLAIRLDSITDAGKTYPLDGRLQTPILSQQRLVSLYGGRYLDDIRNAASGGEFVFLGSSFTTGRGTSAVWITTRIEGE